MFTGKKNWLIVSVIVGLLTVAITAGAVLAQGGDEDGKSAIDSFTSRVAAILGLEESVVQDAFTQAKQEVAEDRQAASKARLQDKLDQMVENGSITQEQADDYMAWLQSKPEGIRPFRGLRGFGGHGFLGKGGLSGKLFGDRSFGGHSFSGHSFSGRRFGGTLFGSRFFGENRESESRFFSPNPPNLEELFPGLDQTGSY